MQEYKKIIIGKDEIIPVAERMRKEGRYLVMIHAFFNKDGEAVSDLVHPFFPGAMEDSKIANLSDKYSPFVKETVNHFWTLRKEFPKLKVLAYDNDLALFNGDFYSKSGTLKPMEAVYKIVYEQTPETVGDAWQQYLNENAGMVQNILDELNAGIQK